MSTPVDPVNFPPISSEQISAFLTLVGAGGACSACGKQDWEALTVEGLRGFALGAIDDRNAPLSPGARFLPMCVIRCGNCGNVRFHTLETIYKTLNIPVVPLK